MIFIIREFCNLQEIKYIIGIYIFSEKSTDHICHYCFTKSPGTRYTYMTISNFHQWNQFLQHLRLIYKVWTIHFTFVQRIW